MLLEYSRGKNYVIRIMKLVVKLSVQFIKKFEPKCQNKKLQEMQKPLAPTHTNACLSQTQMPAIRMNRTSRVFGLRRVSQTFVERKKHDIRF